MAEEFQYCTDIVSILLLSMEDTAPVDRTTSPKVLFIIVESIALKAAPNRALIPAALSCIEEMLVART